MDVFQLPGILLKRWLYVVVPALLFVLLASAYVVLVKPTVPVETAILIDPQGLETEKADLVPQVTGNSQDGAILESQLYIIQSSEILEPVVDKLDLTHDPFLYRGSTADKYLARAATVSSLQKHLTVERQGQSLIVTLTFKHSDPQQGAKIANAIAEVYLAKVHEARTDASSRASGAFEVQAQALAARVRKAEGELEAFKAAHQLVSTGQQGLVIDQQVEGVNRQLLAARADLGAKLASFEQARSLTVGSVQDGAIPEALASTALGSMRARYADLVAQANDLASSLGANHPKMIAARSQVAGMRQVIEQELDRIRISLKSGADRARANVKALEERLGELTKSSLDTSEAGIKARELQSEVDTLRALYKAFLSRSEELGQRDTVNVNNSRIISKAIGVASSSLVAKLMILIAAGLFGVAFGSGLAVLREMVGHYFGVAFAGRKPRAAPESIEQPVTTPTQVTPLAERVAPSEQLKPIADFPPLPVIAHIPARRMRTPLRFSNARGSILQDEHVRATLPGLSETAERLIARQTERQPQTILIVATGRDLAAGSIVSELAQALHHREKDVLFSDGEGHAAEDAAERRYEAPLASVMKYQRLSPLDPPRTDRLAPTFANFANRRRRPDYVLIDARGSIARDQLDALLDAADGILLLSDEREEKGAMKEFVLSLEPWRERMIGKILIDRAA